MKIPPREADGFSRNPPPAVRAILFYGPNAGLVDERSAAAVAAVARDDEDPFLVTELTPAALREVPTRVADEASQLSFSGGRRVVRLRDADDGVARHLEAALAASWEALVVVGAGELPPRSRLRALFEKTGEAAAVACYQDDAAGLARLVREALGDAGLEAGGDVVEWIAGSLAPDRLAARMELEKLALYMMAGGGTVTLEDAQAVIGDSAAVTMDDVADAAAGGELDALARALARARFEGVHPVAVLGAALRHLSRLEEAAAAVAAGAAADQAIGELRPPVFWKRKDAFRAQLGRWRLDALARARTELIEADRTCKTATAPGEAVCERALMRIAAMAGARVPR